MSTEQRTRVLAISGSLRRASTNGAVVEAVRRLAPAWLEVAIFRGLADLPPFNPDVDGEGAPEAVSRFRGQLRASDAILIASPEYAHGVPGVVKNALDWLVASGELIDKPIAVLNTSARATHAWTSLVETLTVMSARVDLDASITIPLGAGLDADRIVTNAAISTALRLALTVLVETALEAR